MTQHLFPTAKVKVRSTYPVTFDAVPATRAVYIVNLA